MHVSTVPENNGMSVEFSHCWDGVVDMSEVKIRNASQSAFYICMSVGPTYKMLRNNVYKLEPWQTCQAGRWEGKVRG